MCGNEERARQVILPDFWLTSGGMFGFINWVDNVNWPP